MSALDWLVVIAGAGLGTYALRAAPFLWAQLHEFGQAYFRFLSYVSFAIAAGIVSRAVFYSGAEIARIDEIAIKIGAVAAALALFRLTRSIPLALFTAAGLAVFIRWTTGG